MNKCMFLLFGVVASPMTKAQFTTRASVSSSGSEGNGHSGTPAVSRDGLHVAFSSLASNLVPSDTNGVDDVFVFDTQTALVIRVSVGSTGAQGNGHSNFPSLSADGRFIAFSSIADTLVPGDSNGMQDVFVHDRVTATTDRISVNSAGVQCNLSSVIPSISDDGRFVSFHSGATNLVGHDTNGFSDVFLRDRLFGETTRVSLGSAGQQGNGSSSFSTVSADGQFISFTSAASNFVPADTNGATDVFVHDHLTGQTFRASLGTGGVQANGSSGAATMSADGRFIAFQSSADNLVPNDTNSFNDAFVYDRQLSSLELVSANVSGAVSNGGGFWPSISSDGNMVVFYSLGSDLALPDSNGIADVFLRDRAAGQTIRVSQGLAGTDANNISHTPVVSGSGTFVVYLSEASNLIVGDTNGEQDVYVTGAVPICMTNTYCTAGTSVQGCLPSIAGGGVPSTTASAGFTISVGSVPAQRYGLIFYGFGATGQVWGLGSSSYLCIFYPVQRTGVTDTGGTAGSCNGVLSVDWNAWRSANPGAQGAPYSLGQTLFAQGWYRDPGAAKQTNLSDGLRFTLCN